MALVPVGDVARRPCRTKARVRPLGAPETLEPPAIARFRSTYDLVVALVIAFVLVFHLTFVALAAGGPPSTARAFLLLLGLGLAVMGNVMPRTRPNPIMGIRTRATLNDPVLWARVHRLFGGLLVASGVLVMLLALTGRAVCADRFCRRTAAVVPDRPRRAASILRRGPGKAGAVVLSSLLLGPGVGYLPHSGPDSSLRVRSNWRSNIDAVRTRVSAPMIAPTAR